MALLVVILVWPATACTDVFDDDAPTPTPAPTIEIDVDANDSAAAARETLDPTPVPTATPAATSPTVGQNPVSPTASGGLESDTPEPTLTASDAADQYATSPAVTGTANSADATQVSAGDAGTIPTATINLEADELPPGCVAAEVAQVVVDFVDAMNQGDMDRLAEIFPDEAAPPGASAFGRGLIAYGVASKDLGDFVAATPDDLMAHLAERVAQHEQRTLHYLAVRDTAGAGWEDVPGFEFYITRQADDLPEQLFSGKGVIDCQMMEIMIWNMTEHHGNIPWD